MRVADLFSLAQIPKFGIVLVLVLVLGALFSEFSGFSGFSGLPGQSFLLALTPSRQMPTEKMALKAGENRLMKSYFDI